MWIGKTPTPDDAGTSSNPPFSFSESGTVFADDWLMLVKHYSDLIAWQLADQFKNDVHRLLQNSTEAWNNFRYRSQLLDATASVTANIVEGFLRFSPGEFRKFIDYSVASLGEAETRLKDGIALGYFTAQSCEHAFRLARRCLTACIRLKQSQSRITPRGRRR